MDGRTPTPQPMTSSLTAGAATDLLALLAQFGNTGCTSTACAGAGAGGGTGTGVLADGTVCTYSPEETFYHWDGPGGPLGDTGLLGWTPISHHVGTGAADAPECRIHPFYNAGEQASGLTSYYPGGTNGCHDGGHDLLVTRSQELWGPVSFTYTAMGGNGGSATAGADENNVAAGFMGAALRKVSDGTYVASARHPCTGAIFH